MITSYEIARYGWRTLAELFPSVRFSAYNVFDKAYGNPGSVEHLETAMPQDRRSVRTTLVYAF